MEKNNERNYYDNTEIKNNDSKPSTSYAYGSSNLGNQNTKTDQNIVYSRYDVEEFSDDVTTLGNLHTSDVNSDNFEEYASETDFNNVKNNQSSIQNSSNLGNLYRNDGPNLSTSSDYLEEYGSEFSNVSNNLKSAGKTMVNDIKDNFEEFASDVKDFSNMAVNKTKNGLEEFGSDASNIGSQLRNVGNHVVNNTRNNMEEFAQDSVHIGNKLKSKTQNMMHTTKEKLEEFASDAAGQIKKVSQNIVEAGKNVVSKTKEKIDEITKKDK